MNLKLLSEKGSDCKAIDKLVVFTILSKAKRQRKKLQRFTGSAIGFLGSQVDILIDSNSHYKNWFFESAAVGGAFKKPILGFAAPTALQTPKLVS